MSKSLVRITNQFTSTTSRLSRIALLGAAASALALSTRAQSAPIEIGAQYRGYAPYVSIGRVTFNSPTGVQRIGTGTAIRPHTVLTCAHNLYAIGEGWNNTITFEWGRYDNAYYKITRASRPVVFGGYVNLTQNNTVYGFSRDVAVLNFATQPSNNYLATTWAYPALLTTSGYNKISVGYAGTPYYTGAKIMQSGSTLPFYTTSGAYMQNNNYAIWGGMSGGPQYTQFNGQWYLTGINVSAPSQTIAPPTGVRALDSEANSFIQAYSW